MSTMPITWMSEWLAAYGDAGPHIDAFFHPHEQMYCRNHRFPEERFAARLAAKRAAQRLIAVRAVDVVVGHTEHGAPTLTIRGAESQSWLVSLTHERSQGVDDPGIAVALVVRPQ